MADSTIDLRSAAKTKASADGSAQPWVLPETEPSPVEDPIGPVGNILKRFIDLLIAVPALICLIPVYVVVALAIRIDSKGAALYRSVRVGKNGRQFVCYKFRSMVVNADELKDRLRNHNERHGPTFKMGNDPRITRLGRFMRRYSIDELPQFLNVVRGEMSIVGPRPHPLDDVVRYKPDDMRRFVVKPGLTCLWQTRARSSPSFDVNMLLDLEYIRTWSLLLDIRIMLATFAVVLRGEGQ